MKIQRLTYHLTKDHTDLIAQELTAELINELNDALAIEDVDLTALIDHRKLSELASDIEQVVAHAVHELNQALIASRVLDDNNYPLQPSKHCPFCNQRISLTRDECGGVGEGICEGYMRALDISEGRSTWNPEVDPQSTDCDSEVEMMAKLVQRMSCHPDVNVKVQCGRLTYGLN